MMQKSEMCKEKELSKVHSTKAIKGMYKYNQVHLSLLKSMELSSLHMQSYIPSSELSITFSELLSCCKAV